MAQGRVVVYGGKGALGSAVVNLFKSKDYWVGSIDLGLNEQADANVIVETSSSLPEQEAYVNGEIGKLLGEESKLDAIFCVAGGWAGGNAKKIVAAADSMWKQSVWPSVVTASIATKYLKDEGLVTLPGAQAAIHATPSMIGYGMAKAAVHHLVKSLAKEDSGLPPKCTVLGTLPVMLDTPMNRKWMTGADFSTWTPLEYVSELFFKWLTGDHPSSGSLVQLITKDNKTELVIS